jgi:cAMP-dependent protein kinase regulator
MFAALEPEQLARVIDAFEEVRLEEGSTVIREGDQVGDDERGLYVLEDGELHVHKGALGHVFTYSKQGDLFGDLALLYNAPRAATVIATMPSVVWCIDRATFNNLVKNQLRQVKERRLEFLKSVEVLKSLDPDQLAKLVDVIRERRYGDGVIVIQEGEDGDEFFILEKGGCRASKGGEFLCEYGPGTYFGELALLENQKRAAQVSTTMHSSMLSLDRAAFDRILGPLKALLKEKADAAYAEHPSPRPP